MIQFIRDYTLSTKAIKVNEFTNLTTNDNTCVEGSRLSLSQSS